MLIRHRSQQANFSYGTTQRILTKDLQLHAYKVSVTQELEPTDHLQRRIFVDWVPENKETDVDFCNKSIFNDEAHFQLNGVVNKQNCRIWGTENPHFVVEKDMHPQRVIVWCGLWAEGVIGPYFFENETGKIVTVNAEWYRDMISNFLWPKLDDIDVSDMWFQQDDAICHTARETMQLLYEKFPGHVISRNGDVNWPQKILRLDTLGLFFLGLFEGASVHR